MRIPHVQYKVLYGGVLALMTLQARATAAPVVIRGAVEVHQRRVIHHVSRSTSTLVASQARKPGSSCHQRDALAQRNRVEERVSRGGGSAGLLLSGN